MVLTVRGRCRLTPPGVPSPEPAGSAMDRTTDTAAGIAPGDRTRTPAPVITTCSARSGSTPLRWLLDAHLDIACPPETDVAELVVQYARAAQALGVPTPLEHARGVVDELVGRYLAESGKRRWCDKSLSNVVHLASLAAAWPESRFVLLHRHAMDVVMSGLDALPWGLLDYGFAPFASTSGGDAVSAVLAYWVDRETRMLAFAERFSDRCLDVRYEDLVARPDEVIGAVWDFVGVEPAGDVARMAFTSGHDAVGPSDYKIWYTSGVTRDSVGSGARVPSDRVHGLAREKVNGLLGRLGYTDLVDPGWGSGGLTPLTGATVVAPEGELAVVELRVVDGTRVLWSQALDCADPGAPVLLDRTTSPGIATIVVERAAHAGIASGTTNMGTALRSRSVRYYGVPFTGFGEERSVFDAVGVVLEAHRELADELDEGP